MAIITEALPTPTLEARQVIVQTITRGSVVFTTDVALGNSPTDSPTATEHHEGGINLSNADIGAIVGSVVGTFLLCVFLCYCCCFRRPVRNVRYTNSNRTSYAGSYGVEDLPEHWQTKEYFRQAPAPYPNTPYQPAYSTPRYKSPRPQYVPPPTPQPPELIPGAPKYPLYRAIPIQRPPVRRDI